MTETTATRTMIIPTGPRVLVRVDDAVNRTDSGIYLPKKAQNTPKTGTIEAVGPGVLNPHTGQMIKVRLDKGSRVVFSPYAANEVEVDGETFVIMDEAEVLGVIS